MAKLSRCTQRALEYASGFLILGLHQEAAESLGEIEAAEREATPVLRLQADLFCQQEAWGAAAGLLARLCAQEPGEAGHWIQYAYATRRHENLVAARKILRQGATLHPQEGTIHFNLACYAAQLGDLDEARERLAQACRLDAGFTELAQTDPDLKPLRQA